MNSVESRDPWHSIFLRKVFQDCNKKTEVSQIEKIKKPVLRFNAWIYVTPTKIIEKNFAEADRAKGWLHHAMKSMKDKRGYGIFDLVDRRFLCFSGIKKIHLVPAK